MKLLVDADGCPVVDIAVRLSLKYHIPCLLLCDTAHELHREGAVTLVFDKGADSVDYALVNRVSPGDIVITQDYGLAAMCLAKGAIPVNQNGLIFTDDNIEKLLYTRFVSKKIRMAGGRTKGPSKRTKEQDKDFEKTLRTLLEKEK